jgi:DNA-binding LacI/PurR family transcriptional regulator
MGLGRAEIMADRPTSFDIAQLAGVSQPTVSRALRGSPSVSAATRLRVEEIAKQLNYKVDKNASSLRTGLSNTIALLIFEDPTPDETGINPFFLSMLSSIMRRCAERGYDLLTSFQQLSSNWHVDYEDTHKADGLILLGYGDYNDYRARLDQLVAQGTHFVRWGSVQPGQTDVVIGSDNVRGGYDITKHLIAQGRRAIAFLGTIGSGSPELLERYNGYKAALDAADLPALLTLQADAETNEEAGYEAALRLIGRGEPFDAIVAASDLIAIGAMRALKENGLSVPNNVAVTGFDDMLAASLTNPPLTTVAQDVQKAGAALVDQLLSLIRSERAENAILPTRLVIRHSCGG